MHFTVLSIFPDMFSGFLETGMIGKAIQNRRIEACVENIRDFTSDRHKTTDDRPYGGGSGMVMKPEPLYRAIRHAKRQHPDSRTILLSPQGRVFKQEMAEAYSTETGLILVCGRYEGIDERVLYDCVDDELSIGDYVMTGGELGAMVLIDAVTRLIPGVLGGEDSAEKESFSDGLLEHAHFTRPRNFEGSEVPDILLSGHHAEIEKWRVESSLIRTFLKRRDLLAKRSLSRKEMDILKSWKRDIETIIRTQSLSGAGTLPGDQ